MVLVDLHGSGGRCVDPCSQVLLRRSGARRIWLEDATARARIMCLGPDLPKDLADGLMPLHCLESCTRDPVCQKDLADWSESCGAVLFPTSGGLVAGSVACFRPPWNCGGGRHGTRVTLSVKDKCFWCLQETCCLLVWAGFKNI